ncbi:MAG TPA: hypothetical protein ENK88_03655 [Campylobacterales bacterium]|nr:hypothetical protein [Campylobacterales bacterium]
MKKFSAPPMIIILDVLFVVLFILVLEQSPNIQIILPKKVWLKDTIVVSVDKNQKIQKWFNQNSKIWKSLNSFPQRERKFNFIIGNIDCKTNKFCSNIPSLPNETKKIYIRGDLYDEISGMISDSCLKFPKQCSNVTYYVKDDGTVDKKRLKEDHQIFRYILKGDTK